MQIHKRRRLFCLVIGVAVFYYLFRNDLKFLWRRRERYDLASGRDILDSVNIPCDELFEGNETTIDYYRNVVYDNTEVLEMIKHSEDRCSLYRNLFGFDKTRPSEEELDYPLAFGIVAHDKFVQFLIMLSSVYETHNRYCVAVPENAAMTLHTMAESLSDCFSNIRVMRVGVIAWGSFRILESTVDCMRIMDEDTGSNWKYFQYLSGVDVPLRTNLEMVRIFKQWNEFSHVYSEELNEELRKERFGSVKRVRPPLKIMKTSLSAVISRRDAHRIVTSPTSKRMLQWLRTTGVADESYWATVLGNAMELQLPGSFDATRFVELTDQYRRDEKLRSQAVKKCSHPPCLHSGFIGRFQVWRLDNYTDHSGLWSKGSYIFGVGDIGYLRTHAALVAHKFYIDDEPAAMFCLNREIRKRREHPDPLFDYTQYKYLPQIEFVRGVRDLTRKDLMIRSISGLTIPNIQCQQYSIVNYLLLLSFYVLLVDQQR